MAFDRTLGHAECLGNFCNGHPREKPELDDLGSHFVDRGEFLQGLVDRQNVLVVAYREC